MSAPDFLDTTIFVYAYDPTEPRKQKIAQELVRKALSGELVASPQVLAEFAAVLLHKLSPPARPADVITALDVLGPIRLIPPDHGMVRRAAEANQRYGVHFYDGMILAAAERAGCSRIWSEDLSAGQQYFGLTVENPF
jgi:predicted nucleic acid-binding protein